MESVPKNSECSDFGRSNS